MNLPRLFAQYGTDDRCRTVLDKLRWPDGPKCLRCGSPEVVPISTRALHRCRTCQYQFSTTVGTIFNDSHLPLTKWFLATYLMVESKKSLSANQLSRTLDVSYKTAWYLCHRIRAAMYEAHPELLDRIVEVDETYIGGNKRWSLFKRSIVGAYHQISTKHMDKYLSEQAFRFDNRKNPYLFRDTLFKLLGAKSMPLKALVNR
jgi:transposase-like protein